MRRFLDSAEKLFRLGSVRRGAVNEFGVASLKGISQEHPIDVYSVLPPSLHLVQSWLCFFSLASASTAI